VKVWIGLCFDMYAVISFKIKKKFLNDSFMFDWDMLQIGCGVSVEVVVDTKVADAKFESPTDNYSFIWVSHCLIMLS
jgi:hypothetical protein